MPVALFQVCIMVSGVCATVYRVKQREKRNVTPIGRSLDVQERTIWNGLSGKSKTREW
jgi:hypothetical protein